MRLPIELALLWPRESGSPSLTLEAEPIGHSPSIGATYAQNVMKDLSMGVSWRYNKEKVRSGNLFLLSTRRFKQAAALLVTKATIDVRSYLTCLDLDLKTKYGRLRGSFDSGGGSGPLKYTNTFLLDGRRTSVDVARHLGAEGLGNVVLETETWPGGLVTASMLDNGKAKLVVQHTLWLDRLQSKLANYGRLRLSGEIVQLAKEGPYAWGMGVLTARLDHGPLWAQIDDAHRLKWGAKAWGIEAEGRHLMDALAGPGALVQLSRGVGGVQVSGKVPLDDPSATAVTIKLRQEMPLRGL